MGQAEPGVLSARPGSRIDVHFVSQLLKSLDWLPAAARGHVLGLLVFLFLSCTLALFLPDLPRSPSP